MTKKKRAKRITWHIPWRTELLVKLALARVGSLRVCTFSDENDDLLVVTDQGFCFFVVSQGFSSLATDQDGIDGTKELIVPCEHGLIERAHRYRNPVVLFYFNADTDHGRYLRLDTLPDNTEELHLPIENTINKASVQKLIREMQAAPSTRRAS
jgi:hypothetical protein